MRRPIDMELDTIEIPDCRMCGGPNGILGPLGQILWFQCRNCGWQEGVTLSDYGEVKDTEAK